MDQHCSPGSRDRTAIEAAHGLDAVTEDGRASSLRAGADPPRSPVRSQSALAPTLAVTLGGLVAAFAWDARRVEHGDGEVSTLTQAATSFLESVITEPLHAIDFDEARYTLDTDSDGLPDVYEAVRFTSPSFADSDADSFEDLEELARGTKIHDPLDMPVAPARVRIGMTACADPNSVRVGSSLFFGAGDSGNYSVALAILTRGRLKLLPGWMASEISTINPVTRTTTGAGSGALPLGELFFMEARLPKDWVTSSGSLNFIVFAVHNATGRPVAAATMNLVAFANDQVVMEEASEHLPYSLPTPPGSNPPQASHVYVPLGGGSGPNSVPPTWTMASVCVTNSSQVGSGGGLVTVEVVSADCETVFDGRCPSTCQAKTGTTYQTIDPLFFTQP